MARTLNGTTTKKIERQPKAVTRAPPTAVRVKKLRRDVAWAGSVDWSIGTGFLL